MIFVVAAFLLSAFFGWLTIPRIVLISKKKRLFDVLSERKSHKGAVPRLGGLAFFPAFLFALTFAVGLRYYYGCDISIPYEDSAIQEIMFIFAGGTILFVVGLSDDLTEVSYQTKLAAQLVSAVMLIYAGVSITSLGGLFGVHTVSPFVGGLLTILVVVLLANAYNLIDGIDGLCSGLSMLSLATFGFWFLLHGIPIYAMLAFAMCGVVCTFFFYNVMGSRLKVFMGDTGSLILGYMIAFLGLKFYEMNVDTVKYATQAAPAVFLGIVFVPAFDALRVFVVRMAAGLSPFYPDRRHIHHKVLSIGLDHIRSTMLLVVIQALFILLNLMLGNININLLFVINIVLGIALVLVLNYLGGRHAERVEKKRHPKPKKIAV